MTPEVRNWIANARGKYIPTPPGRVLEIGSLDVNGQVRDLFTDAEVYIGVDNIAGRNVDVVLNGHDVLSHFGAGAFDLVLCLETLEHDPAFWLTLQGVRAVLKPGGLACISVPGRPCPPICSCTKMPSAARKFPKGTGDMMGHAGAALYLQRVGVGGTMRRWVSLILAGTSRRSGKWPGKAPLATSQRGSLDSVVAQQPFGRFSSV